MGKLKIYPKSYKKKKIALVAVPVSIALAISGFSSKNKDDKSETKIYNASSISQTVTTTENINNNTENIISNDIIPMQTVGTNDANTIDVNYTIENHNEFKKYLSEIEVVYEYENLYNFNASLGEYNKLKLTNQHKNNLNSLTADALMDVVKDNNKNYKRNFNSSIYKEIRNKELKTTCELIINTVNDYIKNNEDISIDRIKCVLADLKIFEQGSSFSNAFVTDDNCLVLSPNMLEVATLLGDENSDTDVIIHEINHLLQKGCNCDLKNNTNLKNNFGFSYNFNNVEVNSIDFSWLYEASAEKNMTNYTGHDPLVYKNMIGYLESLSLVNLVDEDYNVNDTENLSFKRTIDDLYKYFEVSNDKEKKEILNMMYSIEVMQQAPDDFYEIYAKTTGREKDNDLVDEINFTVKASICETLTKLFYANLSENIVNKNVAISDVFYLISLFENDLNNHILYDDVLKIEYNEQFINTYVDIQNNFFYQLAKSTNYSQTELEEKFENYTVNINNGSKNYVLSFLTEDKINYLKEREIALNLKSTISIRNTKEQFFEQNLQKGV